MRCRPAAYSRSCKYLWKISLGELGAGSDQRITSLQFEADEFEDGQDVVAPGASATETDLRAPEMAWVAAPVAHTRSLHAGHS